MFFFSVLLALGLLFAGLFYMYLKKKTVDIWILDYLKGLLASFFYRENSRLNSPHGYGC